MNKHRTYHKLIKALVMALFVCTIQGCINEEEPDGTALAAGDSLPAFTVTLSDGTTVSNSTLHGKVGVIVFFNTNCSDCREELPVIQSFWDKYHSNADIVICPIAREESQTEIEKYWEENGLTMPFSPQENRDVYSLFAPSVIPRIFISNRQGIIVFSSGDSDMPDLLKLSAVVDSLL